VLIVSGSGPKVLSNVSGCTGNVNLQGDISGNGEEDYKFTHILDPSFAPSNPDVGGLLNGVVVPLRLDLGIAFGRFRISDPTRGEVVRDCADAAADSTSSGSEEL